jgi:DNA-binding NarL/FixJ family response regulator
VARRLRVLVADATKPTADFVRHLLDPMVEVIGGVEDGASLIDAVLRLKPDIVITGIGLPVLSGLDAACELGKQIDPPKIIFLAADEELDILEKALSIGASGYVLRTTVVTDLRKAIFEATQGRVFVSRTPPARPIH